MKSVNRKRSMFKWTELANTRLKTEKQIKLLHFVFMNTAAGANHTAFFLSLFQTFTHEVDFEKIWDFYCSVCHSVLVCTSFIQALHEDGSENGFPGTKVLGIGLLWGTVKKDETVALFTSNKHLKKK